MSIIHIRNNPKTAKTEIIEISDAPLLHCSLLYSMSVEINLINDDEDDDDELFSI